MTKFFWFSQHHIAQDNEQLRAFNILLFIEFIPKSNSCKIYAIKYRVICVWRNLVWYQVCSGRVLFKTLFPPLLPIKRYKKDINVPKASTLFYKTPDHAIWLQCNFSYKHVACQPTSRTWQKFEQKILRINELSVRPFIELLCIFGHNLDLTSFL